MGRSPAFRTTFKCCCRSYSAAYWNWRGIFHPALPPGEPQHPSSTIVDFISKDELIYPGLIIFNLHVSCLECLIQAERQYINAVVIKLWEEADGIKDDLGRRIVSVMSSVCIIPITFVSCYSFKELK